MFEEAASGGSAKAHANLGKVYYQGKLVEKDYQKALLYFGKASDLGDVASTYDLGFMYLEGMGTQADTEIAAYHFRRVIETGDSFSDIYKQSLDNLIQFYLDGRLTRRNPDLFLYWVSLKSKSDVPSAYRSLGRFHMQEGRYAEALDLFNELKLIEIKKTETIFIDGQNLQFTYADPQEGILRGFAYANLGRIYRDGLGVEENPAQSEACFTRAVEYGNADGYYWAATKFLEKGDEAQGMDCLLLAADSGSPTACLEIARDFMEGSGMQIPMEERIYYLQQAAEMGSPEAMLLLAESHLLQFPHAPSFSQAFQLALQARNLGSSEALEIIRKFEAIKADNESKGSGSSLDQRLG